MIAFPPCKINLGLSVTGKRSDGYHDIVTCFYPVPWTDVLEIVPAAEFSFAVSGIPVPGAFADNLCVRAYALMRETFDIKPVAMHLLKCIPMGAGLGGGSSDGAFALKLLNDIFELAVSEDDLVQLASQLGSDCPFFIRAKPAMATGRGEQLTETSLSLKGKFLVIVKPEVKISTAEAYASIKPRMPEDDLTDILSGPLEAWRTRLKNDFEIPIFKAYPSIAALQQQLYNHGAVYASMSGSGSAVYGIFHQPVDLRNMFEDAEYWSGHLE